MPENANAILDRRTMLALTAAAITAGVAGCARGIDSNTPAAHTDLRRRFENKVVLITGATSGIGRVAAIGVAAEGGKVAFCGRREKLGREVEAEIKSHGGDALYIRADVRDESSVKAFVDQVVQKHGRLDVAFNNAGITLEKPLHEYSSAEWDDIQNTNLRGVFLAMKYEVPYMLATGRGNIVVTSCSNAIATTEKRSPYTASKRGLVGLVQSAALDYVDKGIRIMRSFPAPPIPRLCSEWHTWRTYPTPFGRLRLRYGPGHVSR